MSDLPPPPPPSGGFTPPPPPPPPGGGFTPSPPPPGGYVPPPPAGYMPMAAGSAGARTDGLAIGALIVGILSLVCSVACLGVLLGPAAAIMGFISRQRISSSGGSLGGGGLAIAGLILGIVGFIGSAAWFFLFGLAFIHGAGTSTPTPSP